MNLNIRFAESGDVAELCDLLNEIIEIGGSTAIEEPLDVRSFSDYFMDGPDHICCFVAVDESGTLWGFQALERRGDLSSGCADIATFARLKPKKPGIGSALFEKTCELAARQNLKSLNATIRADNVSGLSYYTKLGFKDHSIASGIPLKDGLLVDRISKQFSLGNLALGQNDDDIALR